MIQILGLVSGVFFVECFWRNKSDDSDFNTFAVNCDQRRVFCITLGVLPFAARWQEVRVGGHACTGFRGPKGRECVPRLPHHAAHDLDRIREARGARPGAVWLVVAGVGA